MKKVRKSLALDVMDCKEIVTARHQFMKSEPKTFSKVHSLEIDLILLLLLMVISSIDLYIVILVAG